MFTLNNCLAKSCTKESLTFFDENGAITDLPGYCNDHIPDPEKAKQFIYEYINTHDKIVGLNASGIIFSDINLTGKRFYGCNFQHCQFTNLHSEGFRSRMSMFDFAIFQDCSWLKSNMQFTSFAGCTFTHTLFTGSDMIHNNFCGIRSYQSSFDDSDLYNSRFIRAKLVDTSFRNCNIKKTVFYDLEQKNVSFKMSNTREAIFSFQDEEFSGGSKTKGVPV